MRKYILIIFTILLIRPVVSAGHTVNYTDGNSILCLTVHGGFLWAGTKGGIIKWSLEKNSSYTRIGTFVTLPHMRVTDIAFDKDGTMWAGTYMGVVRHNKKKWTFYGVKNGLPGTHIEDVYIDDKNVPWVSTKSGIARFNGYQWIKEEPNIKEAYVTVQDSGNNFFHSCGYAGIVSYKSGILKNSSIKSFFDSAAVGKNGVLWFGTANSGVSSYDGFTWKQITAGLPSTQVYSVFVDRKNRPWVGTPKGAAFLDKGHWKALNSMDGLANDSVLDFAEDGKGNVYIGTMHGISKYDGEKITNLVIPESADEKHIVDAAGGRKNTLWFFLANGNWTTLKHVNLFMRDHYAYKGPLFNTIVKVLARDTDGSSWFGTGKGVVHMGINGSERFGLADGLPDRDVSAIFLERDFIWFGTHKGAVKVSRDWKQRLYPEKLRGLNISDIERDVDGNMWFATLSGAYKIDGKSWTHLGFHSGLPDNRVFSITCEKNGTMWFATIGGLTRYGKRGFKTYSKGMGLANEEIRDVVIDEQNRKWIATSLGVSCLDDRVEFDRMGYTGLGARILLTVSDPALNKDINKIESVTIHIENLLLKTTSDFDLLETGVNTGVFALSGNDKSIGFSLSEVDKKVTVRRGYTNFIKAYYPDSTGAKVYANAFWEDMVSKGNLDGNALVDRHDAAIARMVIRGYVKDYPMLPGTDIDGDGKIGSAEERYALAVNSGKINPFKYERNIPTSKDGSDLTFPPQSLPWDVWKISAKTAGTIQLDKLSMKIPPGALNRDTIIEVYNGERTPSASSVKLLPVGKGFNIYPVNLHFNKPVQVKIKYADDDLLAWGIKDESSLRLGSWGKTGYKIIKSKVNVGEKYVEGEINFLPDSLSRPNRAPFAPMRTVPISNILTHANYFTVLAVGEDNGHTQTKNQKLSSIAMVPTVQVLLPMERKQYYAIGIDSDGRRIDNLKASWHIEKKADVTVKNGLVTSHSSGIFYIKANKGHISKKTIGYVGNCSWCHYFGK